MKRLLVTGFEPFGNQEINPSELLATELARSIPGVSSLILPVDFKEAFQELLKFIEHQEKFDLIVMLGQAGGREHICLERVAHNWMENRVADKRNPVLEAQKIFAEHADAVMTTLPVEKIRDDLNQQLAHPIVSVSLSAGAYVCNNLYYKVLTHHELLNTPSLFVHVPYLPEQIKDSQMPSMDFKTQLHAISSLIKSLNKYL